MAASLTIAPHPATTDLKPLPVPELDNSLDAYSHALEAVLEGDRLERAKGIVEDFRTGKGPELDAKLRERAAEREEQGVNWLHNEWYAGYLTVREPLALSTNVLFQIDLPDKDMPVGMGRAVEFIQRAAAIHLQAAAGETPEDQDARGNRITMNQWFPYAGAIRHPEPGEDVIIQTELDATNREIGVFCNGQFFALQISDDEGKPASDKAIADALEKILAASQTEEGTFDFNVPSLIGSGALAELLPDLLELGYNRAVYDRLANMLFTIDIVDAEMAGDREHFKRDTFAPRGAWLYKPMSYQISLRDHWIGLQVEHSCQDGATLVTAIKRMQSVVLPAEASNTLTEIEPQFLIWEISDELGAKLQQELDQTLAQADKFDVEIITVPHKQPAEMPFKVSRDASAQLTMSIAQELTYGRVRAVYEAVDMREFRAGRTECLRAATPEAVNFAKKLVAGKATSEDLESAINAHRGWVKRCKSGNGFDRHFQMLATVDEEAAANEPFFTDEDATAARRDFLSTTSIGGADQVVRYSFVPSLPEGFGIAYTPLPQDGEFCVSWNTETAEKPEEFRANLEKASDMFWGFCATL
ncbi:choline/carnitine O-acyltransferase [Corynebacterium jeddahense]|uniref:Choline/Carnitine o-acyltransferase n=1 Tax=Corynebacterium jeddahense TaxID=1414719 RepID=A0ABY7UJA0_9CORY|nr:choline/carnitine O-acyltransferase [Corynebacterium jeddahense]WCZ38813.1 Choline/Carnitine o-acyltransferase [Corynebacterium jeddahense]